MTLVSTDSIAVHTRVPPGGRTSIIFSDEYTSGNKDNFDNSIQAKNSMPKYNPSTLSNKDLNRKYSKTFQSTVFCNDKSDIILEKAIRKMVNDPQSKGTIQSAVFKHIDVSNQENDLNPNIRHSKKPNSVDKTSIQTIFGDIKLDLTVPSPPRYIYIVIYIENYS